MNPVWLSLKENQESIRDYDDDDGGGGGGGGLSVRGSDGKSQRKLEQGR